MKIRTTAFLGAILMLLAACSDDVPLGGNDDAGAGVGGNAGSGGSTADGGTGGGSGGGPTCNSSEECAAPAICMLCSNGESVCATADCQNGQCVTMFPDCPSSQCMSSSDCPQMGAPCAACPGGEVSCPTVECINGQCSGSWPGCPGYNPCDNKLCGESCALCDPADPDCVESQIMRFCDANGACADMFPRCDAPVECTSDADCPQIDACPPCPEGGTSCPTSVCMNGQCDVAWPGCGNYDPCVGKLCGEGCSVCDPADPNCAQPAVMMYCDQTGACGMNFPACDSGQCSTDADCPQMGAPCTACPGGGASCPNVACMNGMCVGSWDGCPGYAPCENKACGDSCTICDPADPSCAETSVAKFCDANGQCGMAYPDCAP